MLSHLHYSTAANIPLYFLGAGCVHTKLHERTPVPKSSSLYGVKKPYLITSYILYAPTVIFVMSVSMLLTKSNVLYKNPDLHISAKRANTKVGSFQKIPNFSAPKSLNSVNYPLTFNCVSANQ